MCELKLHRISRYDSQIYLTNLLADCLANFLIGEGKLESFLEEVPPLEANVAKARFGLIEVKRFLNVAITKVSDIIRTKDLTLMLNIRKIFTCGLNSNQMSRLMPIFFLEN